MNKNHETTEADVLRVANGAAEARRNAELGKAARSAYLRREANAYRKRRKQFWLAVIDGVVEVGGLLCIAAVLPLCAYGELVAEAVAHPISVACIFFAGIRAAQYGSYLGGYSR